MKANRLITAIFIATCALFLQSGCEEEVSQPQQLSPDWFDRFPYPAQQPVASANQTSPVRIARLTFEEVVHDFGVVAPETTNLCEFNFKNTGNGVLKIEEVTKACGCTPFMLDKTEYAPGESGTLKVNYITDTQLGPVTKELTVISNDSQNPELTLAVKAMVQSKIDYEPKSLDLVLKGENAGCPVLTISSIDNQPFSITYIRSTSNFITADFDPSVQATSFEIQPKVDMAMLETVLEGEVEIGLTHPECKKITVATKTLPRFTISPRSITVRRVEPNVSITKKIRIINNYGESFRLENATSKSGIVRILRNTLLPGDRGYELEVEITPPKAEGNRGNLLEELSLGISGGLQLKIPCLIFYAGASQARGASTDEECKICGPKLINPKTGEVTYVNQKRTGRLQRINE